MATPLTSEFIQQFPKADIHRHLDGAVRPEVVLALAERFNVKLPTYDLSEFKKLYTIKGFTPETGLFERFAWAIAVMRTPEGLEECAYQAVIDCAAENIRYVEFRFAPGYHCHWWPTFYDRRKYESRRRRVMDLKEVVMYTLLGLQRGMLETGITANLGLCIPRECKTQFHPTVVAPQIVDAALRFQHHGVTHIDLACDESQFEPELYAEEFQRTIPTKLGRTAHADEMGERKQRVQNAFTCVNQLAASRLGHVYHLAEETALMDLVAKKNICIERHPLGFAAPPIIFQRLDELFVRRIPVAIVSDDPALYNQTLTENLKAVLDVYEWGVGYLGALTANALKHAFFASPIQKQRVIEDFFRHGLPALFFKK